MTDAVEPTAGPVSRRSSPDKLGRNAGRNTLLQAGGYGLLAFTIYNMILAFALGGKGPEVVLPRIAQLLNQLPWLIVATLMIFATWNPRRANETGPWRVFTRWFVLMMSVAYLMMVPISFINEFTLIQGDTNRIVRVEIDLTRRSKQIMAAVKDVQTIQEFREVLARIPEVTEVVINAGETPDQIRAAMRSGLQQTIDKQIETLKAEQQQRLTTLGPTVRSTAFGCLIGALATFALAIRLHPWMAPTIPMLRTALDKALDKLGNRPRKLLQQISRLGRGLKRRLQTLKVGPFKARNRRTKRRSSSGQRTRRRRRLS